MFKILISRKWPIKSPESFEDLCYTFNKKTTLYGAS